jgi:hypothetical protein
MKKKIKKYAGGGLSGIAKEANSLMGAADNAASAINTIKSGSTGSSGTVGFSSTNTPMENPSQNLGTQAQVGPSSESSFSSESLLQDTDTQTPAFKRGGKVSSASKRADGIAIRGKTRA